MVPEAASSDAVSGDRVLLSAVRLRQYPWRVLVGVLPATIIHIVRKAFCVLNEQYIEATRVGGTIVVQRINLCSLVRHDL